MKYEKGLQFTLTAPDGTSMHLDADVCFFYRPGQRETREQEGIDEKVELESGTLYLTGRGRAGPSVDVLAVLSPAAKRGIEDEELGIIQSERGAA